jgi:uncharacterized membrane protein YdjX (TVP38/TMEM64 family)
MLLLAVIVGVLYYFAPLQEIKDWLDVDVLRARAAAGDNLIVFGYLGAVSFLALLTAQMGLPTIAGAALFGPILGPVLALVGVAIGGTLQFLVARYALRGPAERVLLKRVPEFRDVMDERGLAVLIFLRFIWFPGFIITLGSAISRLSLPHFLIGFPAMLPQAVLVSVVTDAVVTFGWTGIPLSRWAIVVGITGASIGLYLAAVRRWPELKAIGKMGHRPTQPTS